MLNLNRLVALAALTAALLERWAAVQPVLWFFAAALVPSLVMAGHRLGSVHVATPLALFCLLVPVSLAWNDDPGYSYRAVLTFCAFLVIALWLVVWETPSSALALLAAAAAVTALASILTAVVAPDLVRIQIDNPGAFRGIFTHKNWLALAMGYMLLAAMYLAARRALVRWAIMAAAILILIFAKSTGAYLAIAITLVVLSARAWLRRLPPVRQRIIEVIATVSAAVLIYVGFQWVYRLAVDFGKGNSIDRRFQLWNVALSYAYERPLLGWGWQGTWNYSRGVTGDISRDMGGFEGTSAHNGFVDVFLQVGLIGSALLAILLVQVIWPRVTDPSLRGWSALALFSAIFTISDSFLAGHVPILVIVTGYLFGRNPHLWRRSQETEVCGAVRAGHQVVRASGPRHAQAGQADRMRNRTKASTTPVSDPASQR
ncbi:O-antigen ligase family protein [Mycobacterium sp. B14F4]|uniref:O-antigen ligase family protein n=1 Tax=Mycobacterium sp. B14F4 TaxID=3153565 RepID=UPI00325E2EED